MGRELQKAKAQSSISKVKHKATGRTKSGRRKVNFLGNKAIAENWDRNLTVSQNYRRLGLSSRLNAAAGGVEPTSRKGKENQSQAADGNNVLAVPKPKKETQVQPQTVRVERDPETGKILRVVRDEVEEVQEQRPNPLNDLLNDLEDQEDQPVEGTDELGVVAALETQAAEEGERLAKKRPRQQSKREEEWMEKLVQRYGEDTRAMSRDRKLNPMQQSEGDISRRLRKWLQTKQTNG